jgi:hypothetical protein
MSAPAKSVPDFDTFAAAALGRGYDEVVPRVWNAGADIAPHRHDFAVHALVVSGEMWLTQSGQTVHLRPGDTFELDRGALHAERYGPEGTTYWAARRTGPGEAA